MKAKVLVIHDHADVRLALRRELATLNCDLLEAATVEEARRLLAEHRHELSVVILDLRLVALAEKEGQESGLKLLKEELLSTRACLGCGGLRFNPDVIVLTAWPNVESCREAFLAGALDYLDKNDPNVWEKLLESAKKALERPRLSALFESRKWVESQFKYLLEKFGGQTVAIRDEQVVEAAGSFDELKAKLKSRELREEDHLLVAIGKE